MPKGFGIGKHIREIPGTFVLARTFGHTVLCLNQKEEILKHYEFVVPLSD